MQKIIKRIGLLVALLCSSGAWGGEIDTCSLPWPPPDSGVAYGHNNYMFVYPKDIPDSYTGCQTIWVPGLSLEKEGIARYVDGVLTGLELYFGGPGNPVVCSYEDGILLPDPDLLADFNIDSMSDSEIELLRDDLNLCPRHEDIPRSDDLEFVPAGDVPIPPDPCAGRLR